MTNPTPAREGYTRSEASVPVVYVHDRCGAVVGDTAAHDQWHQDLRIALLDPSDYSFGRV